jgi:hypothetical protein
MAKAGEVLQMLCPGIEYVVTGQNYEDINWLDAEPAITKKQFTDGFAQYDAWKAEQDAAKEAQRQAILDRLGLTADELKTILGGN